MSTCAEPKKVPQFQIPESSSTVSVRVIDTKTILHLLPETFWGPKFNGFDKFDCPVYCFLVSHGDTHIIFDLGVRHDYKNYAPGYWKFLIEEAHLELDIGPNVADILDDDTSGLGIKSTDIKAVIWSHTHFDHTGNMATFPSKTDLVLGPGAFEQNWPGYPTKEDANMLDSDIKGRNVQTITFDPANPRTTKFGNFTAHDYFGDGSFYIVNSPGHCEGHVSAIARTTTNPDTFVFMSGDACHYPGLMRPSEYRPLPTEKGPPPMGPCGCPADVLIQCHRNQRGDEPYFIPSEFMYPAHDDALETIGKLQELDALENVFVVLAHDTTLKDLVPMFPHKIDDWKKKGLGEKTRWLFCKELHDYATSQTKEKN